MNENEVKTELENWVLTNTRDKELTDVPHDLNLIVNRVVDSLKFIELVLLVEEVSERSIAIESIDLKDFETINAIWKSFFT